MAGYIAHSTGAVYSVSYSGAITALALPSAVRGLGYPLRVALMTAGQQAVGLLANGLQSDAYLFADGTNFSTQLFAPEIAPSLTAGTGTGTGLTGSYRVATTYKVKDLTTGRLIAESALGPESTPLAVTGTTIAMANIASSQHAAVNARGVYRTVANGSLYFPWFDVDGNTVTGADRGGPDALLSLLDAQQDLLGTPPLLSHACVWKDRFWGIGRSSQDRLRWSEERRFYAWPPTNEIVLPPENVSGTSGCAFLPRRDALGVIHNGSMFQVLGSANETFQRQTIDPAIGIWSQESVVVNGNTAYFLGRNAGRTVVYAWSDEGVQPISEAQVDSWFNTSTYFNIDQWHKAEGRYNPTTDSYELHVCASGSTSLDRWVSYAIREGIWLGPHRSYAVTPSCVMHDPIAMKGIGSWPSGGGTLQIIGAETGYLWYREEAYHRDYFTVINFDVKLPYFDAGFADLEKVWLRPTFYVDFDTAAAYRQRIPLLYPLAYWKLGEAAGASSGVESISGTTLAFYTGAGNTAGTLGGLGSGHLVGTTAWVGAGSASGEGIFVGDIAVLRLTGALALEAWFKTSSSGSTMAIVGKQTTGAIGYGLNMTASGGLNFVSKTVSGGTVYDITATGAYNDGVWHHAVGVWNANYTDSGAAKIYVDSVLVASGSGSALVTSTGGQVFAIGCRPLVTDSTFSNTFVGSIADVAVYNYELTGATIVNTYVPNRFYIYPTVGDLKSELQTQQLEVTGVASAAHETDRYTVRHLGRGRYAKLQIYHGAEVLGASFKLFGVDLPYNIRGRR